MTGTPLLHRMPSVSVVFFGPAGAGKSTLIGYMAQALDPDKYDVEAINKEVLRDYPGSYDDANYYAYIVDRAKHEIIRETQESSLGTTKLLKYVRLQTTPFDGSQWSHIDIVLIDSPGAMMRYRSRIKGLNFGEIGVFVLDSKSLWQLAHPGLDSGESGDRSNQEKKWQEVVDFITHLDSWLSFSSKPPPIVVISKGDISPGPHHMLMEAWQTACSRYLMREPHNIVNITPIFTEVHVKAHYDKNVLFSIDDASCPAYGPLWNAIEKAAAHIVKDREQELQMQQPVFVIDRKFVSIKGMGLVFRGKVLSGHFAVRDEIRLVPLTNDDSTSNENGATARIRSLQHEQGELVDIISRGDVAGMALSTSAKQVHATRATIAIAADTHYATGNCLCIALSDTVSASIRHLLREYGIVWFGQVLSANAIAVIDSNAMVLQLKPAPHKIVAMPTMPETNDYMFTDVIIIPPPGRDSFAAEETLYSRRSPGPGLRLGDLVKGRLLYLGYIDALGTTDEMFTEEPSRATDTDWSAWLKSRAPRGEPFNISRVKWHGV